MKKERNLGIDLLRILSMLMIVFIHCMGQAGVRDATVDAPLQNQIAWLLTAMCCGAVNLYALITGYVCVDGKHRWNRILELWAQVFFYSVGIYAIGVLILDNFSLGMATRCLFPTLSNRYWYFSSYVLVFFAIPYLVKMLNSLNKGQYQRLLLLCFVLFCGFGWLSEEMDFIPFKLDYGYSPIWLMVLFIVGGYLKRYQEDFTKRNKCVYLAGWAGCVLLTWMSKTVIRLLTNAVLGTTVYERLFYSYLSPTVVLSVVFLFLFFSQLKISRGKKLLEEISSVTFGVYIIHEHYTVRTTFIEDRFLNFAGGSWLAFWAEVFLFAAAVYVICSAIDYLRKQLFRVLHVSRFCQKLTDGVQNSILRRTRSKKEKKTEK